MVRPRIDISRRATAFTFILLTAMLASLALALPGAASAAEPQVTINAPVDGALLAYDQVPVLYDVSSDAPIDYCDPAFSGDIAQLSEGANTITVTCTDTDGLSGSASVSVTLDTVGPTVQIDNPAVDVMNVGTTYLSYTADDASGIASCTPENAGNLEIGAGDNTVSVTCTDNAGNETTETRHVFGDSGAPSVQISEPLDGWIVSGNSVTLHFTATDDDQIESCDAADGDSISLAPGANDIAVTCTDRAQNSSSASVQIYNDLQAPEVSITSPADGALTSVSPATLEFTATDDSGVDPSCDQTSGSAIALTEGDNEISVTCTDTAAHSTTVTHHVTYDATPPSLALAFDPSSPVVVGADTYTLHYTAGDANGIASCTIEDGAALALDPGVNSFTLTCTDNAGLSASQSFAVVRDQAAPMVSIDAPADDSTTGDASALLNYTASDELSEVTCDPAASGGSVPLVSGANVLSVTCTDQAGNQGTASVTVYRDTTPPVIDLTTPADGAFTNVASGQYAFTALDEQVGPNGDTTVTCDHDPGEDFTMDPGLNSFSVTCADAYGNSSTALADVIYDPYPPQVTISAPADNLLTAAAQVTFSYSVDDFTADCDRSSGDAVPLSEGQNTISVTCTDIAGNQTTESVHVTRDSTAPQVTITGPAAGTAFPGSTAQLHYTTSDAHGPVTCNVADGGSIALSVEGENTLTVSCQDALGNSASATRTVIRDTIAPAISISSPANNSATNSANATLHFSVSDATDTGCNKNDGDPIAYVLGTNSVSVSCTDAAGNSGSASASVRYDTSTPTVSITSPSSGLITKLSAVSPTFTAGDDSGQVSCTPSSGAAFALTEGSNTFTVNCTDAAGNGASASIQITRDATPPVVDATAPADNLLTNAAATTLHFTKTDATYTVCTAADGQSFPLDEGANTISFQCDDSAGNSTLVARHVTRDSTPPAVSISSPADGTATEATSIPVIFTTSDVHTVTCDRVTGAAAQLTPGDNAITVSCTDAAGNSASPTVHVTRTVPGTGGGGTPPQPTPQKVAPGAAFSQKKTSGLLTLSFTPPAGASADACPGTATITISVSGIKKPISTTARYTGDSHICTAKRTIKVAKKLKGRKAKAAIAYPGNAWVLPFAQNYRFRFK